MPVVRIDNSGVSVSDKRKKVAKRASFGLVLVAGISVATYIQISPEAGVMVGLLVPAISSLLNLWSE